MDRKNEALKEKETEKEMIVKRKKEKIKER